ncbi:MAG TPA: nucleoside kinase [Anaerolineaceae bacterium]|uniref:Phosphoribulokinase/uridine kinase family protein n=1 Tax=Anaerolinea thermophila TaxID=167964 RepID=A0A101FYF0_9CHLR|nr:MAG: Phosphoribulokinase/uridine kinase family protein [Anaerolinea thermophila]HAF61523.1 nucleoside kinase [Anaerolineaceae bacterium]
MPDQNIKQISVPRDTVEVYLSDGRTYQGKRNTPIIEFMKALPEWMNPPIVGAVMDGELRELTYPVRKDTFVKPINISDSDGSKIYRRSLVFLLQASFEDVFPKMELSVDYSVPSGGYFCRVIDHSPLVSTEVKSLEERMRFLVEKDLPIKREIVDLETARAYFASKNYEDKLQLLKYRKKQELVLYQLENHRDYHHGYMVPSTGFLTFFTLVPVEEGFILQYPRRKTPTILKPMPQYTKLREVFHQYGDWLDSLGIGSVGSLNDAVLSHGIHEIILVSEALHEQKISEIATQIAGDNNKKRLVLISGPSSSGKTTFSKRLAIQLLTHGIQPFALEMDNYFVDRDDTPKDEDGNLNFESFNAINRVALERDLLSLMRGEEIQLPKFNFHEGRSEPGEIVSLHKDQIVIMEGIHGLNPSLLTNFPEQNMFRIYISCLTQLNLDRFNRISTTDTRMLRRIVRDSWARGFTAQRTISLWESVRRGEREHIFPYQENANAIFNSALVYELAAIKPYAEPLLRQIPFGTDEYREAKRLLAFLNWFIEIDQDLIPNNSILREFIGGSILSEFKIWNHA